MATIRARFTVPASPDDVWDVFRDVGAVHTRLAPGFVVDTELVEDDLRRVRFTNGVEVTERLVTVDDEARRLVYAIEGGAASHHNASFEVVPSGDGAEVVWTTDVLPHDAAERFRVMMAAGTDVMREALGAEVVR